MMKHRTYMLAAMALSAAVLTACSPRELPQSPGPDSSVSSSQPEEKPVVQEQPEKKPEPPAPESEVPEREEGEKEETPPNPPKADPAPSEQPVKKEGLSLSRSDFTLFQKGETYQLKATATGLDSNTKITYTSGNEEVATVDEKGNVTAVGPGTAKITVTAGDWKATCVVRCRFEEEKPEQEESKPSQPEEEKPEQQGGSSDTESMNLTAFYQKIQGYESIAALSPLDGGIVANTFPGIQDIPTKQSLFYGSMITMNMGELALVEVENAKDVDRVKAIFQTRIGHMAGDESNPGAAWYPESIRVWSENARVVSRGNTVMMVVGEDCDKVVSQFNA